MNLSQTGYMRKLYGVLMAFTVIFFIFGCQREYSRPIVGGSPPQFTLPDLKGNKIAVPDDFKGKVVIIRFWSSWCIYCAKEMPGVDYVYKKYRDQGLVVLAVNVGQPRDVAEAFVTSLRISYPVLLDPYSVVAKRYGVKVTPTTFIIDRKGVIREKIIGESGRDTVEKMIANLL